MVVYSGVLKVSNLGSLLFVAIFYKVLSLLNFKIETLQLELS